MPDPPETAPPAEWPRQLRAAGALALIGFVWLLVLPVAATAYVGLALAARIRGEIKPWRPHASRVRPPPESAAPPVQ